MPQLGETVLIPAEVTSGAFPGEKLVTLDTQAGPVSGFASTDAIIERSGRKFYLPAQVKGITQDILTVYLLTGSFFTTTGLAQISTDKVLRRAG